MNLIIKPELTFKDVKSKTFTITIHTLFFIIQKHTHHLRSPGNLTFLLSLIFTPLTLSSGQSCIFLSIHVLYHFEVQHPGPSFCHRTIAVLIHFAVGFCDLGADRFYGLCSAIRAKGLKEKMQTQHCDSHSKAKEFNCGRPSETTNKMGHLDRIQITQNLKQKREVMFHRATEWPGVGSEPYQPNQNSFLSELL